MFKKMNAMEISETQIVDDQTSVKEISKSSKTDVLESVTTTTNKKNTQEDSNEEMDLEYSGTATANEPVTATKNQSKKLSFRKIFISNIHLAMTNLSARRALQTMSIWEKHSER